MTLKLFAALACGLLLAGQAARAEIKTENVDYKQGDTALQGFLAYDAAVTGKRPGVLIMHQFMGLTPFEKGIAEKLAKMGYVVFATDVYGKDVHPKSPKEGFGVMAKVEHDNALWRARATAHCHAPPSPSRRTLPSGFSGARPCHRRRWRTRHSPSWPASRRCPSRTASGP